MDGRLEGVSPAYSSLTHTLDPSVSANSTPGFNHPPYDRSPTRALAEFSTEGRAAWRLRYGVGDDAELRVQALLDRVEAALQAAGKPATIRTVWIALADRAGTSDDPALRAAAALAGMAMGLRPS